MTAPPGPLGHELPYWGLRFPLEDNPWQQTPSSRICDSHCLMRRRDPGCWGGVFHVLGT